MIERRRVVALSLASLAGLSRIARSTGAEAVPARTRLVTLGTKGGPRVGGQRANPGNLLLVGGVPYIVDCGYGTARRIVDAGVPLPTLRFIFISHHHSDHNLDYGNIVDAAWSAGLNAEVRSFGPKGLVEMTKHYWELNRFDVETRMADEGKPDPRRLLVPTDIDEGVVLDDGRVKVTAMRTPHPPIVDNFAYRFETPDGVVVFSGDTAYNPKLAEFARGADILVHEALYVPGVDRLVARVPNAQTLRQHLLDSHTSTEDVGRIAAVAKPKLLVLSHFVPGDDPTITDEMWVADVRKHFDGRVVAARDGMGFELPLA